MNVFKMASEPGKLTRLMFHLILMIFFIMVWKGLDDFGKNIRKKKLDLLPIRAGMESRFLTNWNFFLQTGLFLGYLLCDVLDIIGIFKNFRNKFKKQLDFVFCSISAPNSIFVCTYFWTMCYIDKNNIFPVGFENVFPLWLNHSVHTIIVVNVLIHAYLNRTSLKSFKKSIKTFMYFQLSYAICLYVTYYQKNVWVYPFLEKFEEPTRILILAASFLYSLITSIIFHYGNMWYCNSGSKNKSGSLKKKTK